MGNTLKIFAFGVLSAFRCHQSRTKFFFRPCGYAACIGPKDGRGDEVFTSKYPLCLTIAVFLNEEKYELSYHNLKDINLKNNIFLLELTYSFRNQSQADCTLKN